MTVGVKFNPCLFSALPHCLSNHMLLDKQRFYIEHPNLKIHNRENTHNKLSFLKEDTELGQSKTWIEIET